jgi:hypothetical protein
VNFCALPEKLRAELAGDPEAVARLEQRVAALLAAADGDLEEVFATTAAAAAERGEVAPVLAAMAQRLHGEAVAAAGRGEVLLAAALGRRAELALQAEFAVIEHNAHGQLALEHLLFSMRRHPLPKGAGVGA